MRVSGLLLVLLCAACFNPNLGDGGFPCSDDGACPADYTCKVSTCWPAKTAEQCEGVASISGGSDICPDTTLTLTASAGERYAWSTGATSSSIDVGTPGTYRVVVDGCESAPVVVTQAVLQLPPIISVEGGGTSFCPGTRDSITLTSDEQPNYLWSNGATTRSITVTEPGSYTVTSQGCFTSNAVEIRAPITPVVTATCDGNYYTLSAPAASSYAWSNGAVSQNIAPATAGDYTVTIDGCLTSPAVTVAASEVPPVVFAYTGGVQTFTVPTCPTSITITAAGAQGGGKNEARTSDTGGQGRIIRGTFAVTPGESLSVVVGGMGVDGTCYGTSAGYGYSGGGGGGSFVWRPDTPTEPLIAAAGGGGGGAGQPTNPDCTYYSGKYASGTSATGAGSWGYNTSASDAAPAGSPGSNGNGGGGGAAQAATASYGGGGGGGWKSAGATVVGNYNTSGGGKAGAGGAGNFLGGTNGSNGGSGGFGGGGAGLCAGGGGGGYSGGGGGEGTYNGNSTGNFFCGGGAGGSYNAGSNQSTIGYRPGHGEVTITW